MKVLHAIFTMETGGAETMLVDIINQQCKTSRVILLIVNNRVNEKLIESIDKNVKIYRLKRTKSNKWQLLSSYFKISSILKTEKPDVIHCHNNKLFLFFYLRKQKTCLTVHGNNLSMMFVRHFEHLFSVSETVRKDIMNRTGKNSEVIYNGIETETYLERNDYEINLETKGEFKIIQISRIVLRSKAQHIAIEALQLLVKKYPERNIKIYFVGDGEDLPVLKDLVTKCGMSRHVSFLGQKDRTWIQNHLKDYHLLIQPSLYEGFGLTIIEGFAAGLPVIASNVDGPKEILNCLNAGLSTEVGNVEDLAQKINLVYENYISGNIPNTNYVLDNKTKLKIFDIQTTVNNYITAYKLIINNKT
ncbi:MAG: glycosyltransferase [Tannerella sp.]|jgi:glycosyltransferase involved in cell wall biosynthesis|nr:glycosyltransferase [Tannerella sp.]